MSTIDLAEFHATFFDEAAELLTSMETDLADLDPQSPDIELLNAIFRAAHSIKGGAATFGVFELLVNTTHILENVLDMIRTGNGYLDDEILSTLLRARDVLWDQVSAYRDGQEPDPEQAQTIVSELEGIFNHFQSGAKSSKASAPKPESPPPAEAPKKKGASACLVTLINVSSADLETLQAELALMGDLAPGESRVNEQNQTEQDFTLVSDLDEDTIRAICGFVIQDEQMRLAPAPESAAQSEDVVPAPPPPAEEKKTPNTPKAEKPAQKSAGANKEGSSTIRVPTQRVDVLVNQVGEVVINQSILNQAVGRLDPLEHSELLEGFEQMAGALRSLQESIMSLRMVPMDYAFGRYPRVVRDTAAKLKKKIGYLHSRVGITVFQS